MEDPLVNKFLQIPKHLLLMLDSVPDPIHELAGENIIDLEQSVIDPANQIIVVAENRKVLVVFIGNNVQRRVPPEILNLIYHFYQLGLLRRLQRDLHNTVLHVEYLILHQPPHCVNRVFDIRKNIRDASLNHLLFNSLSDNLLDQFPRLIS